MHERSKEGRTEEVRDKQDARSEAQKLTDKDVKGRRKEGYR
jgi:hypothetical protein